MRFETQERLRKMGLDALEANIIAATVVGWVVAVALGLRWMTSQ